MEYAIAKYKIFPEDYVVTDDNKIDNLRNREKPKNVIDFLFKEVNLPVKLVISTVKELYEKTRNGDEAEKKTHKKKLRIKI